MKKCVDETKKFGLVIVGPMDDENKVNAGQQLVANI